MVGLAAGAQCTYFVTATGGKHLNGPVAYRSRLAEVFPNQHKLFGMALVTVICLPATAMGPYLGEFLREKWEIWI
jgi:hypothetical protein